MHTSTLYKNLSARGVLENQELPLFILGPPHISETNRARKLKFGTLASICRYCGYLYKFVRKGASWEINSAHFLLWNPLYISVTNRARKLKFGILVGIYAY